MHFWAWFPFSLIAMFCFGVSSALYKLPGLRGHSRHATVFWLFATGSVLAAVLFRDNLAPAADGRTIILGALWGVCVGALTTLQMYGLKHINAHTLFPVGTTLSLVLTVFAGLFVFHESLLWTEAAGILLTITAVYAFLYEKGQFRFSRIMLAVLPAIVLLSATGKIVQNVAVEGGGAVGVFIEAGYVTAALIALAIMMIVEGRQALKELFSNALKWGVVNGILGFFGTWTIMLALERGPFTLITAVHSMYVFVTALTAHFLLEEKLKRKTVALIALSVLAVVLMRVR